MSVRNFLLLSLTATLLMVRSVAAQPEARIQFVQTGIDHLKDDLKYLVELSPTPSLRKQWKDTLEPLIDSFADGLDPTKPLRVDVIIGKDVTYEMHFPVKLLEQKNKGFIPNLKGMGFNIVKLNDNLYTVAQGGGKKGAPAKNPMYMRYANGYASIAMTQAAVPANMPDPITDSAKGVKPLLDLGFDVVGSMKNSSAAADVTARRKNFIELRKQLEAGLVFKRNEDKNEFALRKLSLIQNLNEAERFVVETEELLFNWTTSGAEKEGAGKGRAEFSISALPDTDLFKSTAVLASKPSYFENVKLHDNGVVSGKTNFGLDSLRIEHLKEFYKTVRPVLDAQIDKRATFKDADQKKSAKEASSILIDMLNEGVELGAADLFMDLHSAGDGKHTMVCGVRAADGKKADGIIKLLPKVNSTREVKMDIKKLGDEVSLHSITIPEKREAAFHKLFPGDTVIYVATSKDAVWGAAGVNAVEALEAAIKQAAEAAPEKADPRVVYFSAHGGRLVELLDIIKPEPQKIDEKLSKDEQSRLKQQQKETERVRKLATEATANCDAVFSGEVKKNGNKVEGSLDVSECVLRFIGSVIAEFSKDFQ